MSYTIMREQVRKHIINKNDSISSMISDQVSQYLSDAKGTVEYVAKNIDAQDMEQVKKEINKVYSNYRWIDVMFYMTPKGEIIYSKPHSDIIYKRDYTEREYYKYMIKNKETYISKVFISSILNQPHIMIVAPVFNKNTGKIDGIVGGGVPLNAIKKLIKKTQETYDGRIYVIDGNAKILVSPDDEGGLKTIFLKRNIYVNGKVLTLKEISRKYSKGVGEYKKDLHRAYVSFNKIENYEGMVVVECDEEYIGKQIDQIKLELIPVIVGIIGIAFIVSMYFSYTIITPIEKLVVYVRRVSKDITKGMKGFKVTNNNEIGELEDAFCGMSEELSRKIKDLNDLHKREKDTRKYLNNILRSAGSGVLVINDQNKIAIFNKAAEKITGIESKDVIKKDADKLIEFLKVPKGIFDNPIEDNKKIIEGEYKIKKIDGVDVFVNIVISSVLDDELNRIGWVCLVRDLTQIKMLENQIKREDKLKTLGELSSEIIHEIGNPLAGMANLLEVLGDHLEDEELRDEIITALREEIDMLNNIVMNFLTFTRMDNNQKVSVNILHLVDSVLNILKAEIKYKQIRVITQFPRQIPHIKVTPSAIRQALVNIIKNSIQAVSEYGIIEIKVKLSEENQNTLILSIRDNGKGMDEKSIDRIFNPFYTTKEDGTGLGLSIVHKIITENKGSICVKSEMNKYTEFIVSFKGDGRDEGVNN